MDWKAINTEQEYQIAVRRTIAIFQAEEDSVEANELALLLILVKDYEDKHVMVI